MGATRVEDWPPAPELQTERLVLEPLRVEHAHEMLVVVGDERMYGFTGGSPPTLAQLRASYERRVAVAATCDPPCWCNWVARERATGRAVGAMQAEVKAGDDGLLGVLAWIVGVEHQGRGFAREAAAAVAAWLRGAGTLTLYADIHPEHEASMAVARALGLHQTAEVVDGERRWMA